MPDVEELEARLAENSEAAEELARMRERFVSFAAPGSDGAQLLEVLLARVEHAFPNFRPASTPEAVFDQLVGALLEFLALVTPWWDGKPGAVAKAGLVVPLSQMPPIEIAALLKAHREGGANATIEWVRCYYDRLFGCPNFLPRLKQQWQTDVFLGRRIKPLSDALDAHAAGLFGASVPTLLAQLEGLIADLSAHRGGMREAKWREYMNELAEHDPFAGGLVQEFVADILAARFEHGADVSSPLSRHAILHGGDVGYGNEVNSRTAILLVDYFAFVSRMRRGLAEEAEPDSANTPANVG